MGLFRGAAACIITVMCGRISSTLSNDYLRRLFRADGDAPTLPPRWNLAPPHDARVIRRRYPEAGVRGLAALRWGLLPYSTKNPRTACQPFNVRAETVASTALFQGAFALRRCIVPAELFYEWRVVDGGRQPHALARRDGRPLALGGIWEGWLSPLGKPVRSFAIITTPANADMDGVHHRMPLVLEEEDWATWLGETRGDAFGLMRPASDGTLMAWPVSTRLNNPRNNDPRLIEPAREIALEGGPNSE